MPSLNVKVLRVLVFFLSDSEPDSSFRGLLPVKSALQLLCISMRLFAVGPCEFRLPGPCAILRNFILSVLIIRCFAPQQQCVLVYERRKRTKWEHRRTKCVLGLLHFMNGGMRRARFIFATNRRHAMPRRVKPSIEAVICGKARPCAKRAWASRATRRIFNAGTLGKIFTNRYDAGLV